MEQKLDMIISTLAEMKEDMTQIKIDIREMNERLEFIEKKPKIMKETFIF